MKKNNAFATFIDEKYIPLDKKFKVIIAVVLFLLPVILFFFFWFQPQQNKQNNLIDQRTKLTRELQQAKAKAANKGTLEAEVAATKSLFDETATLLPLDKEIPALLTNISALGRRSGLDFLTFRPNADVPKDFYSEIPVSITVRGPYHNMGMFLDEGSKLDRIVSVSNITMGSPQKEGSEMLLNSSCRLVTYRFTNKKLPPTKKQK